MIVSGMLLEMTIYFWKLIINQEIAYTNALKTFLLHSMATVALQKHVSIFDITLRQERLAVAVET